MYHISLVSFWPVLIWAVDRSYVISENYESNTAHFFVLIRQFCFIIFLVSGIYFFLTLILLVFSSIIFLYNRDFQQRLFIFLYDWWKLNLCSKRVCLLFKTACPDTCGYRSVKKLQELYMPPLFHVNYSILLHIIFGVRASIFIISLILLVFSSRKNI